MLEWTDRASVHDALVEGIKSVAKSQSIDFDHIAITGLSDGASTATYALIHSRIFSLALLSSCCEDPDVLETDVGEAYISHIRKNDYPLPSERYSSSWRRVRSEEHTSELQSLMRISYAVFCLKKKKKQKK